MITELASREAIETKLTAILVDTFEVDPASVQPGASLYDDLGIDSIDAVDLIVQLKDLTGKKIDPEEFKEIRTVADIVNAVEALVRG